MIFRRLLPLLMTLACLCLAVPGFAAEDEPVELAPVTIVDRIGIRAEGRSGIDREVLDHLPSGNGSLTELLGILPDVQFSEDFRSSTTGGEIAPPDISISGGKAFQNAFRIDGIDNNDLIDPMARTPNSLNDLPGHPQQLFVDSSLVDRIDLYDSNIPARFGGFTGGVIDASLRLPKKEPEGRLSLRHTRDDWTRFHVADEDHFDFSQSNSASRQPRFDKYQFGAGFDLPIDDRTGVLVELRGNRSEIPLLHLGRRESQRRRSLNALARFVHEDANHALWDGSLIYAPYRADYFLPDVENSNFSTFQDGVRLAGGWRRFSEKGETDIQVFTRLSRQRRSAPEHFRNWLATVSKPWGAIVESDFSREGGFGDLEQGQQGLGLNLSHNLETETSTGQLHALEAGLQWQLQRGYYERQDSSFIFKEAVFAPDVICTDDTLGCIDGEQYFSRRQVLRAASESVTLQELGLYLQDQFSTGPLTLRPGLRVDWDDYLDNINPAPRLVAAWDFADSASSRLTLGLNRYYGRGFLAFKLREARLPVVSQYRAKRNSAVGAGTQDPDVPVDPFDPGLWEFYPASLQSVARFAGLKTPYSDEIALGFDRTLAGGHLSLKLIQRQGRDEFARTFGPVQDDGLRYYFMTNDGRSRHRSLRLSWERSWRNQTLLASWVWQANRTSNESYDALLDDEEIEPRVWYRGRIVYRSELPRADFSRPHVVKLLHMVALPHGLSVTTQATWLSAFDSVENTYRELPFPNGERRFDAIRGEFVDESLFVYDEVRHASALQVDVRFAWQLQQSGWPQVTTHLDVFNLLDRRIESSTSPGTYRLGRQVWLGVDLVF